MMADRPAPTPPRGPRAQVPGHVPEEPSRLEPATRLDRAVDAAGLIPWEITLEGAARFPGEEEAVWTSRRLADALGIPGRELPARGADLLALVHVDDRDAWRAAFERTLRRGEPLAVEARLHTGAGEWRWYRARGLASRDTAGGVTGAAGVLEDVTGRRVTELQTRHAQKMEAVGRLAGGIAHDFNNLLSVITTYAALLTEELPAADPRREYAEQVARAADRAATITRQLLTLSRKQVIQPVEVELNALVIGMAPMLRRLAGPGIELDVEASSDLWRVWVDPAQFQQVIVDLVLNGRDAMPSGGALTLATANEFIQSADAVPSPDAYPGRFAVVSVTDTGHGIAPEVMPHVFDPFFSTKGPAGGAGLGLSVVYGAIRQAGGFVAVSSRPGAGTTVRLYLPAIDRRQSSGVPRPASSAPPESSEEKPKVLVVEDDEQVRRAIVRILRRAGYQVAQAESAGRAIRELRSEGIVDLLLTDVILPGPSGTQLASDARRIRPGLPVLFVSGFTGDVGLSSPDLDEGSAFLEKPFSPSELLAVVASLVRGRSSGPPPIPT